MKVQIDETEKKRIQELARPSFFSMCPIIGGTKEEKGETEIWLDKRERRFSDSFLQITYREYKNVSIKNEKIWINDRSFPCKKFTEEKEEPNIKKIVVYGMCISQEEESESDSMLENYYEDCYKIALLDGAREWLQEKLQINEMGISGNLMKVSQAFGPGFFGMGMETIPDILALMDAGSIGLKEFHGALFPDKSNVGFYLVSDGEVQKHGKDCASCLGQGKNCSFCVNR